MPLSTKVVLGPGNIVFDADPAPTPRGRAPPQFSGHVCCGQTAGWIKMPLDTKVVLGPCYAVLGGDPGPLVRGTALHFRPMSIVAKRSPILATAEHLLHIYLLFYYQI